MPPFCLLINADCPRADVSDTLRMLSVRRVSLSHPSLQGGWSSEGSSVPVAALHPICTGKIKKSARLPHRQNNYCLGESNKVICANWNCEISFPQSACSIPWIKHTAPELSPVLWIINSPHFLSLSLTALKNCKC